MIMCGPANLCVCVLLHIESPPFRWACPGPQPIQVHHKGPGSVLTGQGSAQVPPVIEILPPQPRSSTTRCILMAAPHTRRPCLSVPYRRTRLPPSFLFYFMLFSSLIENMTSCSPGPDGWSQRIEKVINFTGITTCQAVNTHCFVCLRATTEQLSLLLGGGGG